MSFIVFLYCWWTPEVIQNITPLIVKKNNLRYLAVLAKHQLTKESSILSCTGKLDLIFFH